MSQQWRGAPRATGWENYTYTRNRVSDAPLRTIAGPGCWCGQPHGHDWPGKSIGAPHPREGDMTMLKEERVQARKATEDTLKHSQIKKFDREVRDAVLTLVNTYGVPYRLQRDGQHLMLYTGKQGERPFKVSASRPAQQQLAYLVPWLVENYPEINIESAPKKETAYGVHLFEDSDGNGKCRVCGFERDDGRAEHISGEEPSGFEVFEREEWEPFVYQSGKQSEFLEVSTKEKRLRCIVEGCGYTKEGSFTGIHLHEAIHSGEFEEITRKSAETRKVKQERKVEVLAEALDILLKPHGYVAVRAEDVAEQKEVESLRAENERLRKELDEIKAKFDLAREAFGL